MKVQNTIMVPVLLACLAAPLSVQAGEEKCADEYSTIFPCPGGQVPAGKTALFMDQDNGVVTDLRTEMVWERGDDKKTHTWNEANSYCDALVLGDRDNWRLPTYEELDSITEFGRSQNVMNEIFAYQTGNYWTSTAHGSEEQYRTIGYFDADSNAHSVASDLLVRCISDTAK